MMKTIKKTTLVVSQTLPTFCITAFLVTLGGIVQAQDKVEMPSKPEQKNIRLLARTMIESHFRGLLNTIAFDGIEDKSQIDELIKNAYLPNNNQIFYNDGAIIEDDITPANTATSKGGDRAVGTYLSNLNQFYKKTDRETIFFSEISVSEVKLNSYLYLKVYFKSEFRGQYNDNNKDSKTKQNYWPVLRVAELRVEKNETGRWTTLITYIGFYSEKKEEKNALTTEQQRIQNRKDSVATVEYKQALQTQMEAQLLQGEVVINSTNNKVSAIANFTDACYHRDKFKLSSPKFETLYKEYLHKGDMVFDAEVFDKALEWYKVAQSLVETDEIKDKIKACRR